MTAPDPFLGQLLNGRYRILSAIGQGGMGRIYKAEQLPLGRVVAVKVLSVREADIDSSFERRFFLEASLCARLSHPNIVTIHDYGRIEGGAADAYFMAMEFIDGITLFDLVRSRGGCLSVDEATYLILEIARGLRVAHKAGVIHRDLKPGNVMVVGDEENVSRVKILDFGLVKSVAGVEQEALTKAGVFVGSPAYMSPEQVRNKASLDHRTDIYSLGVILYKCLTGKAPFEGDQLDVMLAHIHTAVPPLKQRNPACDVPAVLEELVLRMTAKEPAARPATVEQVIRELREIRNGLGLGGERQSWESITGMVELMFEAAPEGTEPQPQGNDPTGAPPATAAPALIAASSEAGDSSSRSLLPAVSLDQPPPTALSGRWRAAALVGASLVFVGLVASIVVLGRRGPAPGGSSMVQETVQAASVAQIPVATAQTPVAITTTRVEAVTAPAAATTAPAAAPASPAGAQERAPHVASKRVKSGAPSLRSAAKASAAAAPAAPAPSPPARPAPAAVEAFGFLTIDASPWANVKEDGRLLGTTPILKMKLSAGIHTLTLENPESRRATTYLVTIRPGQTISKKLGLE